MEKLFTDEFLDSIGFKRQTSYKTENFNTGEMTTHEVKYPYGRAIDKRTNGMTVLQWNDEGQRTSYFGEKIPDNTIFLIGKDGGTRTVFNGYVYDVDDVKFILARVK